MGKFVMECPSCGKYMEVAAGLLGWFAKKSLNCVCGYTIDVRTESAASKVCEHCGNTVVYDQAKGEKAICPICHNKINTREGMKNLVEFTCPSCKCKLSAEKERKEYTCPLCETVIDVEKQIKIEEIKKKSAINVIKYEGKDDIFVWKHPIEDFNWGSQLIVHESQEVVFFRDGKALDLFGAGRYTLETQNMPFMEDIYEQVANTNGVFHSEIYFINIATKMGIKWGTPSKIRMFDPVSGIHIEIGVSGNFDLKVNNSRKLLLKIVGTESSLRQNEILKEDGKFRPLIINKVKANLARTIKANNINILEIDEYIDISIS